MTKLNLTQAWVTRATSEPDDDFIASGIGFDQMPIEDEVSAIFNKIAGTDAVKEMVRRKWFQIAESKNRQIERAKAFQGFLFSQDANRQGFASALFRRQNRQRDFVEELATMAWIFRLSDKANAEKQLKFDAEKLIPEAIARLVRISKNTSGPRDAIAYLGELGIRVVIESSLPGMRTDGASFIAAGSRPIIGLTLRYDRIDSFWFTLLHELGHIVLHLQSNSDHVFIDSLDDEDLSEVEAEANAFAKDAFVPRDAWLRSEAFRSGTEVAIQSLANKFEIHPAIIAGRLRFERNQYQKFAPLLGAGQVRNILMTE